MNLDYIIIFILLLFIFIVAIVAYVILKTPESSEFETLKIRFAAVTFTGIMVLILVTAVLGIHDTSGHGMEVFKTVMTGLSPIAGGIVGYLFSAREKSKQG
ncbi:hypothetical protein LPN04_06175 [Rugamonas sp. A1-17]|nr:hypothetical protein [Rugamonas sp. A1-17]